MATFQQCLGGFDVLFESSTIQLEIRHTLVDANKFDAEIITASRTCADMRENPSNMCKQLRRFVLNTMLSFAAQMNYTVVLYTTFRFQKLLHNGRVPEQSASMQRRKNLSTFCGPSHSKFEI